MKKMGIIFLILVSFLNADESLKKCKPPIGNWPSGASDAIEIKDDYIFLAEGGLLHILQISTGYNLLSRIKMPDVITDILAKDDFLYIACDNTCFIIVNIEDPENPVLMGIVYLDLIIRQVVVKDLFAFLATHDSIVAIDISNPYYPHIISTFYNVKNYNDLAIYGNFLFAVRYFPGPVDIFDVSDPANPVFLQEYNYNNFSAYNLYCKNDKLYIVYKLSGVYYLGTFSLSLPLQIEHLGSIQIQNKSYDIYVSDNYAFVSMYNHGMVVIDITDPYNPQQICIWWSEYIYVWATKTVGTNYMAYIATHAHGMHKVNFYPNYCNDNGYYSTNSYTGKTLPYGNYAFGTNVLLISQPIFDISNPKDPHTEKYFNPAYLMGGRDVAIYNDLLMYSSMGYPSFLALHSIADPLNPSFLKLINMGSYGGCYLISDKEEPLFLFYCSDGFIIINVSNPTNPIVLYYDFLNYIDKAYLDYPLLFLYSSQRLYIYDISDIYNPILLTTISISLSDIFYEDPYLYLLSNNYLVIYGYKISEPPELITTYDLQHNCNFIRKFENELYISCYIYIDNGRYKSLLKKLGISQIENPEVKSICYTNEHVYHMVKYNGLFYASQGSMGLNIYKDIKNDCIENLGDINNNKKITSLDASFVLQYVVGLIDLNEEEMCRADVDNSDKISSLDASYILQCVNENFKNIPFLFRTSCGDNTSFSK